MIQNKAVLTKVKNWLKHNLKFKNLPGKLGCIVIGKKGAKIKCHNSYRFAGSHPVTSGLIHVDIVGYNSKSQPILFIRNLAMILDNCQRFRGSHFVRFYLNLVCRFNFRNRCSRL